MKNVCSDQLSGAIMQVIYELFAAYIQPWIHILTFSVILCHFHSKSTILKKMHSSWMDRQTNQCTVRQAVRQTDQQTNWPIDKQTLI